MPRTSKSERPHLGIIPIGCFVTGVIIGAAAILSRGEIEQASVGAELAAHIMRLAALGQPISVQEVLQSIVGNMLFVVIIWVLAFARFAGFTALMVVVMQGASYGFTTAALVANFGVRSGLAATLVYLPQMLILAPTLLYVCTSSLNYVSLTLNGRLQTYGEAHFRQHIKVLAIAAILAVAAAMFDVLISPLTAQYLFREAL